MSQRGSCARFAQETLSRGVVFEVSGVDDLQGNREAQIGIVSLVGDSHRPATQLPKAAILPPEYLVLVIARGCRHGRSNKKPEKVDDYKIAKNPSNQELKNSRRTRRLTPRSASQHSSILEFLSEPGATMEILVESAQAIARFLR